VSIQTSLAEVPQAAGKQGRAGVECRVMRYIRLAFCGLVTAVCLPLSIFGIDAIYTRITAPAKFASCANNYLCVTGHAIGRDIFIGFFTGVFAPLIARYLRRRRTENAKWR
jgi:hypothetical protein